MLHLNPDWFCLLVPAHLGSPRQRAVKRVCVFHIFIMGAARNFKFGLWVSGSKSQPADDNSSLKGAWSLSRDIFEFYTPLNICVMAKARDFKFSTRVFRAHHEETRCLQKQIMQGTMPGACRRGRPRTAWMDNINTCTGLSVEESVRMTEDRDKWRKYVHRMANLRIEDG